MTDTEFRKLIDALATMPRKRLDMLQSYVNGEQFKRAREAEHFAHLSSTVSDPRCYVCRGDRPD